MRRRSKRIYWTGAAVASARWSITFRYIPKAWRLEDALEDVLPRVLPAYLRMIGLSFGLYLSVVALIAYCAWRRTTTIADFMLGGRSIGAPVAALSAGASDMSGWLLLGLPGLAVTAPAEAVFVALGLLVGTWCNWRFVARPLRVASAALGVLTLPEFFARRLPERGAQLRILTAAVLVLFFLLYTAAGLVAGGKLFTNVFDLSYTYAVALCAFIVMTYTLFGGFLAVSWTDVMQALLMASMLVLVAYLLWDADGGHSVGAAVARSRTEGVAVVSALAWGLGYMGQPHILARFMAIKDPADVQRARRIAISWTAASLLAALLIGIGGSALLGVADDPESVFIVATEALLSPWLSGVCLAAVLAAIMSTADSQLLVCSTALAEDLAPYFTRTTSTSDGRLRASRLAVVATCAVATVLALKPNSKVFDLVQLAWAGFGATLGPALLIALYRKDATAMGAIAGMLTGGAVVTTWRHLPANGFGVYELLPAFVAAIAVNLAVNKKNDNEKSRR